MATDLYLTLVEATLATSVAALIVLALRRPIRVWLGARTSYGLWGLVPAALVAIALPAASLPVRWQTLAVAPTASTTVVATTMPAAPMIADSVVCLAWLLGALVVSIWIGWRHRALLRRLQPLIPRGDRSFLSAAADGPMLVGSWRPMVVLPLAFEQDFPPEQQALMLAHERAHRARGDAQCNALAAALTCLFWFNPLFWLALRCFRFDQELACDASVIEQRPQARRAYAQAMLHTQMAGQGLHVPLGCQWPAGHPLKERITMLTQPLPTPTRRLFGQLLLLLLTLVVSIAVWATQPANADPSAKSARLFDVRVLLSTPGAEPLMPSLIVREGERAGFKSGEGAAEFAMDFKINAGADGIYYVSTELKSGGVSIGKPGIGVRAGEPGSIAIGESADSRVELTLWVTEHTGALPGAASSSVAERSAQLPDVTPPPRYPADAFKAGIEGEVVLDLKVDANGIVRDVRVVKSEPAAVFDAAAVDAARGWWLNPVGQAPGALPGWVRAPIKFSTHE